MNFEFNISLMIIQSKEVKNKILIMLVRMLAVLVAAIIISLFLIQKIEQKSGSLLQKRILAEVVQRRAQTKIFLQEDFKKVEPYLNQIKNVFPDQENLVSFLSVLEALAAQTGNQQSFIFENTAPLSVGDFTLNRVVYRISLAGNYDSALNYFRKFEKLPYVVKINNFDVSGSGGLDKGATVIIGGEIYSKYSK